MAGARVLPTARQGINPAGGSGIGTPAVPAAGEQQLGQTSPLQSGQGENPVPSVYYKQVQTAQGPVTVKFTSQINPGGAGTSLQPTAVVKNVNFNQPINQSANGFNITGQQTYTYTVANKQLVATPTTSNGQIVYNGVQVGTITNGQITAQAGATVGQPIYASVPGAGTNQYLGTVNLTPTVANGQLSLGYLNFQGTAFQVTQPEYIKNPFTGQFQKIGVTTQATTSYNANTGQVSVSNTSFSQLFPGVTGNLSLAPLSANLGGPANYAYNVSFSPATGASTTNILGFINPTTGQITNTLSSTKAGIATTYTFNPATQIVTGQSLTYPTYVPLPLTALPESLLISGIATGALGSVLGLGGISGQDASSQGQASSSASSSFSAISNKPIDLLNQSNIGSLTKTQAPPLTLNGNTGTPLIQLGTGLSLQGTSPKDVTNISSNIITTSNANGFTSLVLTNPYSFLNFFTVKTTESRPQATTLAGFIGGPHNNVFTSTPTTYTTVVKSNNPILSGYNSASSVTVPTTGFENVFHAQLYYQQQAGYAQAYATYNNYAPSGPVTLTSLIAGSAAAAGTIGFGLYAPSATITQRLTAIGTVAVMALPLGEGIGAIANGAVAGGVFTEGSSLISTGKSASGQSLVISAITAGAFVGAGELVSKFTPELYAAATGKTVYYRNTLADYVSKYGTNAATNDFYKTLNTFGADTSKAYIFASRSGDIAPEGGLFYNAVNMGHMQASDIQAYLRRVQKTTGSNFRLATTSEGALPNDLTVAGKAAGNEHFGGVRKYASGPQEGIYLNLPSLEGRAINLNYNQNIMARAAGDVGSSNAKLKFTLNPFGPKGGLLSTGVDTSEISLASKARFTRETGIDVNTPEGKTAFSQWLGEKSIAQGKSFHYPYQNYFPGTDEAQVMANVDSKITSLASRTAVFKSDFSHSVVLKLNTAGTGAEAEGTAGTGAVSGTGTAASYAAKGNLASAYSSASSLAGTKVVSLWSSSPGALASGILSSTSSSPIASSMVSEVAIISPQSRTSSILKVLSLSSNLSSNNTSITQSLSRTNSTSSFPSSTTSSTFSSTPNSSSTSSLGSSLSSIASSLTSFISSGPSSSSTSSFPSSTTSSTPNRSSTSPVSSSPSPSATSPSPSYSSGYPTPGTGSIVPPFGSSRRKGKNLLEGYRAFIIKNKQKVYLPGIGTKSEELQKGANVARNTLVATFGIEDAYAQVEGGITNYTPPTDVFRNYRIVKGNRVPLVNEYIEKAGTRAEGYTAPGGRLGTIGEQREIQGLRKNRFRFL